MRPARAGSRQARPTLVVTVQPTEARVRRSSRLSRPREASSGCPTFAAESSSARATTPPRPDRSSHSCGDGCGSQRCTSRDSPSACSSSTSVTGRRVWPNSDSRDGQLEPLPSRAQAARRSRRAGGPAPARPTRATSRRHSSACHSRSSSSAAPAPSVSRPSRQSVTSARPLHGVRREEAGQPAGDGVAAVAPQQSLVASQSRDRDGRQASRTTARRGWRRSPRAAATPAGRGPTRRRARGRAASRPATAG